MRTLKVGEGNQTSRMHPSHPSHLMNLSLTIFELNSFAKGALFKISVDDFPQNGQNNANFTK